MSDVAIEFRGVSKAFTYNINQPRSLKTLLVSLTSGEYFRLERTRKVVLDNVDFKINRGEIVGIMGRNGTGKSTLMRILSGIYSVDSGEVTVNGRVAPMIAMGAGFHPELSGYENIFLNGAILGIPRSELLRLVPKIIEFSELESDMDKPVKNYSTGMLLRLGFSVASHIEAPILLLDEVLGVGDAGFVGKCFAKLQELFQSGRTVVMVTHDPQQVIKYCKRCLVLENGKLIFDGDTENGTARYIKLFEGPKEVINNQVPIQAY
jgi:ABC-type polysaccharide/polyol phosphate transport system ATPase subunit